MTMAMILVVVSDGDGGDDIVDRKCRQCTPDVIINNELNCRTMMVWVSIKCF